MITDAVIKVPAITPELLEKNEEQQQHWRTAFNYVHPTRETHADRVIDDNLRILNRLNYELPRATGDLQQDIRGRISAMSHDTAIWASSRGQFELAARLAQNEHDRTLYLSYEQAVERSDDEWCEHPTFRHVDGELDQIATREFDFPSDRHAGTVSMVRCRECGFRNARQLPVELKRLSEHRRQVRAGQKKDVGTIREAIGAD